MRKAAAIALAIASVGSGAYLLPRDGSQPKGGDQVAATTRITTTGSTGPAATADQAGKPRVFSAGQPLAAASTPAVTSSPQAASPAPVTSFVAPPVLQQTQDAPSRKLSSSRPADDDARRELVRDLQRELKRVGCYDGEINGVWAPSSKRAMGAFTDRVNATLPLDEPDYILLTLVQGHTAQACGKGCPTGQGMNESGKCIPRAVLAQTAKRPGDKPAAIEEDRPAANRAATTTVPKQPLARSSSAWSTVVTEAQPPQPPAPVQARPVDPLPGRMAMGAPVDKPVALPSEVEQTKAALAKRKAELAAAAEAQRNAEADSERRARIADVQARKAKEALASKQTQEQVKADKQAQADSAKKQAQADQAKKKAEPVTVAAVTVPPQLAPVAAPAPPANRPQIAPTEKQAKQLNRPAAVAAVQGPPVVYRAPPQRLPPPYGVGRVVTAYAAPRPSYAPEPRRWTRTIFSDISRMR
jgi:hypothetical protein